MENINNRLTSLIQLLEHPENQLLPHQYLVGLERETLRIDHMGQIAQTAHPISLGSALTHPVVTTDFSEAQLELVTEKPLADLSSVLDQMTHIHAFVSQNLKNEYFWPLSMPMATPDVDTIKIAQFGTSNQGYLKEVYRQGLVHRYGKKMQIISGLHFNHSYSSGFWTCLHQSISPTIDLNSFITDNYFHLCRNYLRWCWLVTYLFGQTPVIDHSFLDYEHDALQRLDSTTLYGPYATSLRMSNLGYANSTRCQSYISYNGQSAFLADLLRTLTTSCQDFTKIGLKESGRYKQISDTILQIENELYSFIRPKQPLQDDERPYNAVKNRGISYIEIRGIDIDPNQPIGISLEQLEFLRVLILYCLLADSEPFSREEERVNTSNQALVALMGRKPGLKLQKGEHSITLMDWAQDIFEHLRTIAQLMDRSQSGPYYLPLIEKQYQKILNSDLTPSAIHLEDLKKNKESHHDFGLRLAQEYHQYFENYALDETFCQQFKESVENSIQKQSRLEQQSTQTFEEYLKSHQEKLFTTCPA